MANLKQTIEFNAKGVKRLEGQMKRLEKQNKKLKKAIKGVGGAGSGAGTSFKSMALKIGGSTVAFMAAQKAMSFAIRVGKEFEQSMANVKAISGATGATFLNLEADARKLGASTKFTATEVAGLQTEYAKLGFTAKEIVGVTEGTLALASAVGSDLATSAAVAGATLRGFGLDVKQTGRVTDVMAQSFSKSALDMAKFSDSMKYVAPISKMAGISIEGTTAILGQLANAGIDGSMAGTSLRKVLLEAGKEGSKLAIRMGGPIESFEDFQEKLQNLKDEGFDPLAEGADLVGQRAVTAFGILLDGVDSTNELHESLLNAGGAAQRMAEIQLDTLEGKMTIMKSATEGLGIAFFDTFDEGLKDAVSGITNLIGSMTEMIAVPMSAKMEEQRISAIGLLNAISNLDTEDKLRKDLVLELETKYGDLHKKLGESIKDNKLLKTEIHNVNTEMMNQIIIQGQQEAIETEVKGQATAWLQYREATKGVNEVMVKFNQHTPGTIDLTADLNTQIEQAIKFGKENHKTIRSGGQEFERYTKGVQELVTSLDISRISQNLAKKGYSASTLAVKELQEVLAELRVELAMPLPESKTPPPGGAGGGGGVPPVGPTQEEIDQALAFMDQFQDEVNARADIARTLEEDARIVKLEREKTEFEEDLERLILNKTQIEKIEADFTDRKTKLDKKIAKERIKQQQSAEMQLAAGMASALKQFAGGAKAAARIQQVAATIDAWRTINKIMADPKLVFPTNVITATAVGASAFANVMAISKSIGEFKTAATGMDEIVSKPTMILAGEAGPESVNITPLGGGEDTATGGSPINITFSGNVTSDNFIEEEAIPKIKEAIRRGADLGVSA